jgi:aspartate/methionine/tyrosine aminotransferase
MSTSNRSRIPPFHVMRVVEAAVRRKATGQAVFNLSVGQPATPAPRPVLAAAHASLDSEVFGYTVAMGIEPLREAIAGHYGDRYGLTVSPEDVVVTTGSSGAFLLAFLAAFDPGDVVAMARPGYPAYRNMLAALGCAVVEMACDERTRCQPTIAMLEALDPRPQGLVLASPANPTGTMVSASGLAAIAEWCERNDVRLISDEIYHGITYRAPATSAWHTNRSGVVINSFSKYFSMTGWRLGWMLTPADLLDSVDRLATNLALCAPAPAQYAAVRAFDDYGELDANVEHYRRNRAILLEALPTVGLDRLAPSDGAFYVYADVSDYCVDSMDFGSRMLAETGVAVAPGVDFDPIDGHRFIRISFAGSQSSIAGALDVLSRWLPKQRIR